MKRITKSTTLMTGFAIFSMFFGAGNVVFPLRIGQTFQSQVFFGILGLLISSVCIPLIGLISMMLFNGDYKKFFQRIGKIPGSLFTLFIMLIIGPFGASPRTIALSYSTIYHFYPFATLPAFSFVSCLLIFALAYNRSKIIDILGKILTPFLLLSLFIIIIIGIVKAPDRPPILKQFPLTTFFQGLMEGYQTMDLLATPFFASVIIACLKQYTPQDEHQNSKKMIFSALKASFLAAFLLSIIYIGFAYVAALHSQKLKIVEQDKLIAFISDEMLGSYGGIIASVAVALACLTTAVALSSIFAEFIHKNISFGKIRYATALTLTMIITFFISTLNFSSIVQFLSPVLQILYPVLIVLSFVNLLFKLRHFQPVKWPVYTVLGLSIVLYSIIA